MLAKREAGFVTDEFAILDLSKRGDDHEESHLTSEGSYLLSSSKGLHYESIEKIPRIFPMKDQPISTAISMV